MSYEIVFRGKLVAGVDESTARGQLARLFKTEESKVAALFGGGRKVLKRGLSREQADKYRQVLKEAGLVVAVVSDQQQAAAKEQPEVPASAPSPAPTAVPPQSFGREIKAAYEGRASFQIDEAEPARGPTDHGPPQESSELATQDHAKEDGDLEFTSSSTDSAEKADVGQTAQVAESEPGVSPPEARDSDGGSGDDSMLAEPGAQIVEAEQSEAPDIDTSALTLSDEDFTVDESGPPEAPEFDTSQLSASDDFDQLDESERPEAPEFDLGEVDMLEVGATVDESDRPPALEIDTSALSMDEDFAGLDDNEKPARPAIDTSQLSLDDEDAGSG